MNIMHTMASETRTTQVPKRRFYSPELKLQVVSACAQPVASIAGVALQHGINANIVHRCLREHSQVPEGSATAKALDYSLRRWAVLTRLADDGQLPVDNNWIFAGSLRAGQRAAAVMSLTQSARMNGHDLYAYLRDVLTRLPTPTGPIELKSCCHITGHHADRTPTLRHILAYPRRLGASYLRGAHSPQPNRGCEVGWFFLLAAGICEIFYAAAIPRTDGFTRLWPSLFCATFIALSMYLLSLATRSIPIGTAYAVWVGIGAVGTAVYGIIALGEDKSLLRMLCFALIIAGIAGLKLLSSK